jgi:uncharacterized cupredoxin-like copper-binding protein
VRARIAGAAAAVLAAAMLAACGGSDEGSGTAAATSSSGSASGSAEATTVQVSATDFALKLSTTTLHPGAYTFEMTNDGKTTHAIEVDGPGVEDEKSDTVGPSGTASLTVTLQDGNYRLYCPVDSHRAMGMETTFTVGG